MVKLHAHSSGTNSEADDSGHRAAHFGRRTGAIWGHQLEPLASQVKPSLANRAVGVGQARELVVVGVAVGQCVGRCTRVPRPRLFRHPARGVVSIGQCYRGHARRLRVGLAGLFAPGRIGARLEPRTQIEARNSRLGRQESACSESPIAVEMEAQSPGTFHDRDDLIVSSNIEGRCARSAALSELTEPCPDEG